MLCRLGPFRQAGLDQQIPTRGRHFRRNRGEPRGQFPLQNHMIHMWGMTHIDSPCRNSSSRIMPSDGFLCFFGCSRICWTWMNMANFVWAVFEKTKWTNFFYDLQRLREVPIDFSDHLGLSKKQGNFFRATSKSSKILRLKSWGKKSHGSLVLLVDFPNLSHNFSAWCHGSRMFLAHRVQLGPISDCRGGAHGLWYHQYIIILIVIIYRFRDFLFDDIILFLCHHCKSAYDDSMHGMVYTVYIYIDV